MVCNGSLLRNMFYKAIEILLLFTIFCLCLTGHDEKSENAEHFFARSFATNKTIVSDMIEGQHQLRESITNSLAEICPFHLNNSKKCFPVLRKTVELFNLANQRKWNLIIRRNSRRLYAKTSRNNYYIFGSIKAQAFIEERFNHDIYNLSEREKALIAMLYLYVIFKYYGAGLRTVIFKIRSRLYCEKAWVVINYLHIICKYFGVGLRVIILKISSRLFGKLKRSSKDTDIPSPTKVTDDLPTTPSEKTDLVLNEEDISRSNLSCYYTCEEDIFDGISRGTRMSSEDDRNTTSSSFEDTSSDFLRSTSSSITSSFDQELKHSHSFDSFGKWNSHFDESCDEEFPDEFFIFPSDNGNIGLMLGPEDWEKIEPENLSDEELTSQRDGTFSTGIMEKQNYEVAEDGGSVVSSRYSPVHMDVVSSLSCVGSNENPVVTAVGSSDGKMKDTRQTDCQRASGINIDLSDSAIKTLECGDYHNAKQISTADNYTENELLSEDCGQAREIHQELAMDVDYSIDKSVDYCHGEFSDHENNAQELDYQSDVIAVGVNNTEYNNQSSKDINENGLVGEIDEDEILDMDHNVDSSQGESFDLNNNVQESDCEIDSISIEDDNVEDDNQRDLNENGFVDNMNVENEIFQDEVCITFEKSLKNHVVAAAIFTGLFVLPCLIAARLSR